MTHPPPFKHNNFDQYPLIAPQPLELMKKVQLALIGSRHALYNEPEMNRVRYP